MIKYAYSTKCAEEKNKAEELGRVLVLGESVTYLMEWSADHL